MAKAIPLTQGKIAIVDDENYKWLNQWKWRAHKSRNTYYAVRAKNGEHIAMHREILGLTKGDGKLTDHKSRNGLDNQEHNLRICTSFQNQHNRKPQGGTSKYKGVSWNKRERRWQARIESSGKTIHIGNFTNELKAAEAYDRKAKELFGEFACINF